MIPLLYTFIIERTDSMNMNMNMDNGNEHKNARPLLQSKSFFNQIYVIQFFPRKEFHFNLDGLRHIS